MPTIHKPATCVPLAMKNVAKIVVAVSEISDRDTLLAEKCADAV